MSIDIHACIEHKNDEKIYNGEKETAKELVPDFYNFVTNDLSKLSDLLGLYSF